MACISNTVLSEYRGYYAGKRTIITISAIRQQYMQHYHIMLSVNFNLFVWILACFLISASIYNLTGNSMCGYFWTTKQNSYSIIFHPGSRFPRNPYIIIMIIVDRSTHGVFMIIPDSIPKHFFSNVVHVSFHRLLLITSSSYIIGVLNKI